MTIPKPEGRRKQDMKLDDVEISRAIIRRYTEKLEAFLESDVCIVGGGPAGLTAAYYLAGAGRKVAVLERKLSLGGGMWGGGMMFNEIVVQEEARTVLEEFGIRTREWKEGYFTADSVECTCGLGLRAAQAGAAVFNLLSAEDVLLAGDGVGGLVLNWSAVEMGGLHVDPLTVRCSFVVDASGHAAEVAHIIQRKIGTRLLTETGSVVGEQPMLADAGEKKILANTREFYPGVYAAGMACNAIFGAPRMGPVFGGMLLSGKKVAGLIDERL
jgi:thiamine thiazole synthase